MESYQELKASRAAKRTEMQAQNDLLREKQRKLKNDLKEQIDAAERTAEVIETLKRESKLLQSKPVEL